MCPLCRPHAGRQLMWQRETSRAHIQFFGEKTVKTNLALGCYMTWDTQPDKPPCRWAAATGRQVQQILNLKVQ